MAAFRKTSPAQKAYTQLKRSVKAEARKCFTFIKREAKKAGLDVEDLELDSNAHQDSFYITHSVWNGRDFETIFKIRFSTHETPKDGWTAQNKRDNEFSFTSKYEARTHCSDPYIPNWDWADSKAEIKALVHNAS